MSSKSSPFISIVIPYYNNHNTLFETCEPFLGSRHDTTEIIVVVDPKSKPLGTLTSIGNLKRVSVVSGEETGPGSNRNLGLERARGLFTYFLDADDLVHLDGLLRVARLADTHRADVISFNTVPFTSDSRVGPLLLQQRTRYYRRSRRLPRRVMSGKAMLRRMWLLQSYKPAPGLLVARTNFLRKNSIDYRPQGLMVDNFFTFQTMWKARRCLHRNWSIHQKRVHLDSISASQPSQLVSAGLNHAGRDILEFIQHNPGRPDEQAVAREIASGLLKRSSALSNH